MAIYVIGDVQGCFDELQALLCTINFNVQTDSLWFAGDLVNRGPKSLQVLRYVSRLPNAMCVLGNHDLSLLALGYTHRKLTDHTLDEILSAPDFEKLLAWLKSQPLIHVHQEYVIVHAGIPPQWTIQQAVSYAQEVESLLRGPNYKLLLENIFGDEPDDWCEDLIGWERYRFIVNALTRLRCCKLQGRLEFSYKAGKNAMPNNLVPWFKMSEDKRQGYKILFGHWAALRGVTEEENAIALDTDCSSGGRLTAMRLDDGQIFSVPCGFVE